MDNSTTASLSSRASDIRQHMCENHTPCLLSLSHTHSLTHTQSHTLYTSSAASRLPWASQYIPFSRRARMLPANTCTYVRVCMCEKCTYVQLEYMCGSSSAQTCHFLSAPPPPPYTPPTSLHHSQCHGATPAWCHPSCRRGLSIEPRCRATSHELLCRTKESWAH